MSIPVISDDVVQKIRRLERQLSTVQEFTDADLGDNIIYNYHITTGAVNSDSIANATITGGDIASATIVATNIANATITATQIANATITGTQIATGTITGTNIQDATITGSDIGSGVITGTNIGTATITSTHIQDATIQGADIASATIAAGNIVSGTITATQIANATITATQIASATITGTQIASATITSTHIQDLTITASDIANATITGTQIASATVTSGNIQDLTIVAGDIANTTITAGKIVNNTITATQIANNTITAAQIANTTITAAQIQDNTITAAKITDLTITSSEIADLTITGAKIAAATLTADKITVTSLSALSANLGTITAGSITGVTITGVTFQTSGTNPRVFMDATGIGAIQANGLPSFKLDASTGKISTLAGVGGFNLMPNASFEDSLAPLSPYVTGVSQQLDSVTFPVHHGLKSAKLTRLSTTGQLLLSYDAISTWDYIKILPTTDYVLSAYIMPTRANRQWHLETYNYSPVSGFIKYETPTGGTQDAVLTANQWNRVHGILSTPSTYQYAVTNVGNPTSYWRMGDPTVDKYAPLGAGAVTYMRLGETSGTQATDSSGNNSHGTYVGSPTFGVAGALANDTNTAIQFNGTNAGISHPQTSHGSNSMQAQTISFWLWWDSYANDDKYAILRGPVWPSGTGGFWVQPNNSGGKVSVGFFGDVAVAQVTFNRPSAAAWHHYAIVISTTPVGNDVLDVYVDGVIPAGYVINNFANNTSFGAAIPTTYFMYNGASSFSAGRMDEIIFSWHSAWTPAQIRDAYRIGKNYLFDQAAARNFLAPATSLDAGANLGHSQPGLLAIDTDKSLGVNGTTAYYPAEAPSLDISTLGTFSISGWGYLSSKTGHRGFFGSSNVTSGFSNWFLYMENPAMSVRFFNNYAVDTTGATWGGDILPLKQKFHWALTYNNSTRVAEFFLNGVSQGTRTLSNTSHASPGFLRVGTATGSSVQMPWDGYLDEVVIWQGSTYGAGTWNILYTVGSSDPYVYCKPYFYQLNDTAEAGEIVYLDSLQLEQGTVATAFAPKSDEYLSHTIGGSGGNDQIVPNTIANTDIVANTITAAQIAATTITGSQIAANTISATNIATGTITATQIASATITSTQIAASTIVASNIAAGTITGTQIAANTITASKLTISSGSPNILSNSSFRMSTAGIPTNYTTNLTSPSISASGGPINDGYYFTATGLSASNRYIFKDNVPVLAGKAYAPSAYFFSATSGVIPEFEVVWKDNVGATISTDQTGTTALAINTWRRDQPTSAGFIAPAGAITARVGFGWTHPSSNAVARIANVQFEQGDLASNWSQYIDPTVIDGTSITGALIQTSLTNPKLTMDSTKLQAFDGSGVSLFELSGTSGLTLKSAASDNPAASLRTSWADATPTEIGRIFATTSTARHGTGAQLYMEATRNAWGLIDVGARHFDPVAGYERAFVGVKANATTGAQPRIEARVYDGTTDISRTILSPGGGSDFIMVGGAAVQCKFTSGGTQGIAGGAASTVITFPTSTEVFDQVAGGLEMHDSTNTGRFYAQVDGIYMISSSLAMSGTISPAYIYIRKNGGATIEAYGDAYTNQSIMTLNAVIKLSFGDYVELVYQNTSGQAVTIVAAQFSMLKING